jgi:predicted O-linked N-acetylglucosamine transferase (SPINDLY family)
MREAPLIKHTDPETAELVRQAERQITQGNPSVAAGLLERALTLAPENAQYWFKLGVIRLDLNMHQRAESCFRKALAIDPRHAKARINLGAILQQTGKGEEAARCYREALQTDPSLAHAWFNLGTLLLEAAQVSGAIEYFRRALALDPRQAEWHVTLGSALGLSGQLLEALDSLRAAVRINPALAQAHLQLAASLMEAGEVKEALGALRQARELDPAMQAACSTFLFALNFSSDETSRTIFEQHVEWARRLGAKARERHDNKPDPVRRLRLGYICADFADASVVCLIEPVLARHDPSEFEVVCYSDAEVESNAGWRLRTLCAVWHATAQLSNEQLGARISEDQIDILVDLAGHAASGKRMPLFAQKAAPIQISWLRYPCTTGLEAFDYRIADWQICPEGIEPLHTERLVRMPASQWCFKPQLDIPAAERPPAGQQGDITFGSFHACTKLSPPVIAVWAKLLRRVPGSRLVVAAHGSRALASQLAERFRAAGGDPDRVEFLDRLSSASYFSLHNRIDISLDSWPYAGVAATFNSLWMGVPVVTLRGETAASRSGASILSAIDLHELVAGNEDEYENIAVSLAMDRTRLAKLRRELRARLERSPLMDSRRFTNELESSYRAMWRAWCAETPPPRAPSSDRLRAIRSKADGAAPAIRYPRRVVVDGVFFQGHTGGIARVWRSLLREWLKSGFAERILFLDRGETAPQIPGMRYRAVPKHSYDGLDDDRALLQRICDEEGAEAFISTYYSMPVTTPAVMLVHDMIPEVSGADLSSPTWQEKHACISYAQRFIAVSTNTARDLCRRYPLIRPDQVIVAHNGVDPLFCPADSAEIERFKRAHRIMKPYFLLVGSRAGYKNIGIFFRAFAKLADRSRYGVLCVGGEPGLEPAHQACCAGSDIHMLKLDDGELRLAYCGAIALVYPSLYEGFGMPVIEALSSGSPVITTSLSSLPEVAGDAAIYIDPMDVEGLAVALEQVQKRDLRSTLIARGTQRAKIFSWAKMATRVALALSEVASANSQ